MSVVPQAANSGVTSPLFGGPATSPHTTSAHPPSARSAVPPLRSPEGGHVETPGSEMCGSSSARLTAGSTRESKVAAPDNAAAPDNSAHANTAEASGQATPVRAPARSHHKPTPPDGKPLHRLAEVRVQQGISERTMARRLGIDLKSYREMEDPHYDLTLSQLTKLQEALDVPIADLLEDHHALSRPVHERAKLLKVMKTAVAMREAKINPRTDRMAQMLCEQLIDLMPELAEVSGWPQFGARRGLSAIGKVLQNPIDTSGLALPE